MVEHPPYKWDKIVRFYHEVPSFVSVDDVKAKPRKLCELTVRVRQHGNWQVTSSTTYL